MKVSPWGLQEKEKKRSVEKENSARTHGEEWLKRDMEVDHKNVAIKKQNKQKTVWK